MKQVLFRDSKSMNQAIKNTKSKKLKDIIADFYRKNNHFLLRFSNAYEKLVAFEQVSKRGFTTYALSNLDCIFTEISKRDIKSFAKEINFSYIKEADVRFCDEAISELETPFSQWNLDMINRDQALNISKGKNSVVAIIDTGVDYNHPEIKYRFSREKGYDFVRGNTEPLDFNGHGTHVAGSVAGEEVGVSKSILKSYRVLNARGSGSEAHVVGAIDLAISNSIDIANLSLGSPFSSRIEEEICNKAFQHGVCVIAAAGNSGYGYNYPAAYDSVIAVAAVDRNKQHANFSNRNNKLNCSAPGVNIYSCSPNNTYRTLSGTSMATPHTAGSIALLRSLVRISPHDIQVLLKRHCEELGSENEFGYGLIRPDLLLKAVS